jgi:hypothetical protein
MTDQDTKKALDGKRLSVAAALAVIAVVAGSLWVKTRDASEPAAPAEAVSVAPAPKPTASPPPLSSAASAFVAFTQAAPPDELPLDHGYTAEGLRRLAAAVAVAGESALWRDRAKRLEAAAAQIEKDSASLQHADVAREAFLDAADWLDAEHARAAASALSAGEPLRSQGEQVNRFFRAAAASMEESGA